MTETLRRNDARQRYELEEDGEVVGIRREIHEPAQPQRGGHHVDGQAGGTLVTVQLDDIGAHGQRVVPKCPFVKRYIETHPEYADLVA